MQVHILGVVGSLTFSADRPAHSDITCSMPTGLAVGAGGDCLDNFVPMGIVWIFFFSLIFLTFWDIARFRLKRCLKWPLNPKEPTILI